MMQRLPRGGQASFDSLLPSFESGDMLEPGIWEQAVLVFLRKCSVADQFEVVGDGGCYRNGTPMRLLFFPATTPALRVAGLLLGVWLLWATSGASPAQAHPHAWIDLRVAVLFDSTGALVGLRETWLFDEYYTAFATEGMEAGPDALPSREQLDILLRQNIKNLSEYDYFTRVWHGEAADKQPVPFLPVVEMDSRLTAARRLEMTFVLRFAEPVSAWTRPVVYAIYDPTYYVEMLHAEKGTPIRLEAAPAGCAYQLHRPNPNPEMVALAAALDTTQSPEEEGYGSEFGSMFAQRVSVQCRTPEDP